MVGQAWRYILPQISTSNNNIARIAKVLVSDDSVKYSFSSGKFPRDSLVVWMDEDNVADYEITVGVEIEAFNGNLSEFKALPVHLQNAQWRWRRATYQFKITTVTVA